MWHYVFGFIWTGSTCILVLSLMHDPEPYSRAETVQIVFDVLCVAAIVVGVVGRLLTPGAFWHS